MRDNRLKPGVDVVLDILKVVAAANPDNQFAQSILVQYQEKGGLSKKQLEGLYGKAQKIKDIPVNKLATLEAIILRKKEKTKSALPEATPLYTRDTKTGGQIEAVLAKYPAHKRVLYLQSKYQNNEPFSAEEMADLQRFYKLLK
jgi:3-hydroxyacyl-CoA dehydrogenase